MVEIKSKVVSNKNGVRYVKNVYVDSVREYNKQSGAKKKEILENFSIADQLNILRKSILKIASESNVEVPELQAIEDLINKI